MSDNYVDQGSNTRIAGWDDITDPGTGWLASKIAGWTADRFSDVDPGHCLTVDFSAVVPVGTKAVRVAVMSAVTAGEVYYRKGGDTAISNTPSATQEYSHLVAILAIGAAAPAVVWLSASYTADFAIVNVNQDLYVAHPVEYLL